VAVLVLVLLASAAMVASVRVVESEAEAEADELDVDVEDDTELDAELDTDTDTDAEADAELDAETAAVADAEAVAEGEEVEAEGEEALEMDLENDADADVGSEHGQAFELEESDVAGEDDDQLNVLTNSDADVDSAGAVQQVQQVGEEDADLAVAQEQTAAAAAAAAATDADADADAAVAVDAEASRPSHRSAAEAWTLDGKVLEVGEERVDTESIASFKEVVGKHIPALVEFYIPTCGHCQGFAPEYSRLAKAFKGQPVLIARVNAHRWEKLADEYHVSKVPDLRYFPKGSLDPQEYRRPRALEDLTIFLNDYAGTNVDFMKFKQVHSGSEQRPVDGFCPLH